MKKLNYLWLVILALVMGACESEMDKVLAAKEAELKSEVGVSMLGQTRAAGNTVLPMLGPGSQVGLIVTCEGQVRGPLAFTMNSTMTGLVEPLPIIEPTRQHVASAYAPYDVNASNDPARIEVTPVKAVQTQYGNDDRSAINDPFYISPVGSYYMGDNLNIQFVSTFTDFHFAINTNIEGLVVKSIKLEAPGKIINFTSAYVDGTKAVHEPGFAQVYGHTGGTSTTVLNIEGGLNIPNSTTETTAAYMNISPFDCSGEQMKVTVTASDNKVYTFTIDGENYTSGSAYEIPIRIEKEIPKPVIKNIRVLSICEVGSLGTKDNTRPWNCYYGALNNHAKEIRKLLHDYFGKGKLVETGVISFDKTDTKTCLNRMRDCDLDRYDIIYLNNNARPSADLSRRLMNWLNRSEHRVLMLAYDWKDPSITPWTNEKTVLCRTSTNYMMFKNEIQGVTPHWYNHCKVNKSIQNWGAPRSRMLVPFELNEQTKYFWKEGPFKTTLNERSDQRFWIEDCYWGSACVTDPNVIQLIKYKDARNDCYTHKTHKYGYGDGGMVLGLDPTKRIVYIGDSEIFSTVCVPAKLKHARMATTTGCHPSGLNNYSRIMGNIWAWMIQEVIQKP